jgi:excisionase family DNA binding protein
MTAPQAARLLKISAGRLYRAVRDGRLRARESQGRLLLRRIDVERYARRRDAWLRLHGRAVGRARMGGNGHKKSPLPPRQGGLGGG